MSVIFNICKAIARYVHGITAIHTLLRRVKQSARPLSPDKAIKVGSGTVTLKAGI